jgi:hypothetical protein
MLMNLGQPKYVETNVFKITALSMTVGLQIHRESVKTLSSKLKCARSGPVERPRYLMSRCVMLYRLRPLDCRYIRRRALIRP